MQSMSDDPRQILAEAGVECAEVDEYAIVPTDWFVHLDGDEEEVVNKDAADAAILALARLVEKYKWIAEHHASVVDRVPIPRPLQVADLERIWEERNV